MSYNARGIFLAIHRRARRSMWDEFCGEMDYILLVDSNFAMIDFISSIETASEIFKSQHNRLTNLLFQWKTAGKVSKMAVKKLTQ